MEKEFKDEYWKLCLSGVPSKTAIEFLKGVESLMEGNMESERVIKIDGCVMIDSKISHDDFLDMFIKFVESHDWTFGGATSDVTGREDYKDNEVK